MGRFYSPCSYIDRGNKRSSGEIWATDEIHRYGGESGQDTSDLFSQASMNLLKLKDLLGLRDMLSEKGSVV